MSATFTRDPVGGAKHLMHTCDVCGAWGSFGYAVQLRKAIEQGNAKKAGTWRCNAHRKEVEGE